MHCAKTAYGEHRPDDDPRPGQRADAKMTPRRSGRSGAGHPTAKPSAEHKRELASVIHLCGAGAAKAFAQRGFRLVTGERCSGHDVANYLARVKAMEREFLRLAASPRSPIGATSCATGARQSYGRPQMRTGCAQRRSISPPTFRLLSGPAGASVVSDRGALFGFSRVRRVQLSVALLDAASPLVPGNRGADMVWAGVLACSGDFLLRLTGCQGKDLIAEVR